MMDKEKLIELDDKLKSRLALKSNILKIRRNLNSINIVYFSYSGFKDKELFYIRKANFEHRLKSYGFHCQLISDWLDRAPEVIDYYFKANNQSNIPLLQTSGFNKLHNEMATEIYSLFDSCIYHQVSTLDFLSSFIHYCFGPKSKYQKTLMWTSLSKSTRDQKNNLSKFTFAHKIDLYDREFFSRLYDHRSALIHREGDVSSLTLTFDMMSDKASVDFVTPEKLSKKFTFLKDMSKNNDLSIECSLNWISLEFLSRINDILKEVYQELKRMNSSKKPNMTIEIEGREVLPDYNWEEIDMNFK